MLSSVLPSLTKTISPRVAAELGLVLTLRGLTVAEYVAGRDPISGSAYLFSLGVFALAPWAAAVYLAARERPS